MPGWHLGLRQLNPGRLGMLLAHACKQALPCRPVWYQRLPASSPTYEQALPCRALQQVHLSALLRSQVESERAMQHLFQEPPP